jgi:hypothetical protein
MFLFHLLMLLAIPALLSLQSFKLPESLSQVLLSLNSFLQVTTAPQILFNLFIPSQFLYSLAEGVSMLPMPQAITSTNAPLARDLPAEPQTIRQAQQLPEWSEWHEACEKDLGTLEALQTYSLVHCLPNRNPIKCIWVCKHKTDENGRVCQWKARLVAQGYSQVARIDYKETYVCLSSQNSKYQNPFAYMYLQCLNGKYIKLT